MLKYPWVGIFFVCVYVYQANKGQQDKDVLGLVWQKAKQYLAQLKPICRATHASINQCV